MGVNKQVFASNAEKKNFKKLRQRWGSRYEVYHNLPFLNLFNTENLIDFSSWELKPFQLGDLDRNRLKKTSVDYTLCNENDEPLICIDFDGLNEGINVGTSYRPEFRPDPWREKITELKLKVAHASFFPYFVLGSREFNDLSKEIRLTIVDGVIGDVLSARAARRKLDQGFLPEEVGFSSEAFEVLDPDVQQELIQDWVTGVETEMDLEINPVHQKVAQMTVQLGYPPYSLEFIYHPSVVPPPPAAGGMASPNFEGDLERLKERKNLCDSALYQGVKCVLLPKDSKRVEASVLIPNFKTPYFRGLNLSEEIAHLLALERFRKRNVKQPPPGA